MRVLVVHAHPYEGCFCHAVLDRVTSGIRDGGHVHEVDPHLYAVGAVDAVTRGGYLDLAYTLGRDFAGTHVPGAPAAVEGGSR